MKKIIKLPIESTTQVRKTEDSLCELYSHDKNNGLFEFEVTNVKLGNEKPYAMFKFMDSMSVWKVLGTIEDNKIKVAFDTTLITQDETVVCFLYLDDEERTTDFYRFKFKVKVSEIDKLHTYAVKERYFNNSIIVDKLDVVTKDELKEALKGLTVSTVEGVLTENRADEIYAKKSELYDDTALRQRVATLEERPDNNTIYDDSDLRGRVIALESKADNDTVYDDADLKRRVSELENKSDKDTVYDDSDLRGRVEALESKPDNNTVYDDTDVKNRLKAIEDTQKDYVRTEDLPAPYDDRRVKEQLEALETKTDNIIVYDDTDLKTRVEALENRPNNGTAYDDSDLKRRVSELEQRPDNNTVYDDTDLSNRVKTLEDAPKVNATDFATKNDLVAFNGELNNKVSSVDFEDFKKTIPAPYNDKTLSDRVLALENKPSVGQTQDTGWLKVSGENAIAENIVEIRRIANTVHVRFRNENGDFIIVENIYSILDKEISGGFGSVTNNSPIFSSKNNRELGRIITNVSNNRITVELSIDVELQVSKSVYINEFSYITDEPFPTNLN
jgi:hypothetical protein